MGVKRRGHGEGSIIKRPNGTWAAVITLGTNETGKRNRKWVYGRTKKEVTDRLAKLQTQRVEGTLVDSGRMTVGDLVDRWLSDVAKPETAPNTYTRYESVARLHVKTLIGGCRLTMLRPMHVQAMLAEMERNEEGSRTRGHAYAVIRRALNVGVKWGLIYRNPCDAVDPPKYRRSDITTLTNAQSAALVSATLGTRWNALFVLAITAGMRQGELFGLMWEDIDLDRAILSVRRSLEEVKGRLRLKETKSKSGRRQIALPPCAVQSLSVHRDLIRSEGLGDVQIVFCDSEGKFLRKSNFARRVWKGYRSAVGIPAAVTFHDLRHTSATILLGAGIHPKIVQERLGHSTIQLTMDTYSHVLPSMQEGAASKFDFVRLN